MKENKLENIILTKYYIVNKFILTLLLNYNYLC